MLFAGSIYVLKQRPNKLFLVGSIVLFILTTAITILFFLEVLLEPVATRMSTFIDGTTVPCSQLQVNSHETVVGSLLVVLVCACRAVMFVISDAALIFHCAVLWDAKKWIAAFPSFLLFASTACNLAQVYYGARIYTLAYHPAGTSTSTVGMAVAAAQFTDAATSLSLATNVLTSFLIALKIWRMTRDIERELGKKAGSHYRYIIAMFIESGVLFSVSLAAELAMTFAQVPTEICEVVVGYAMAISPTLVIVCVRLGAGFDNVDRPPTTMLSAIQFRSGQEVSVVNSESSGNECELEKVVRSRAV